MKRLFLCLLMLVLTLPMVAIGVAAADGTVLNEAQVRQVVTDFVRKRTEQLGLEVTIRKIGYRGDLVLPVGAVSYEVLAPRQWEGWGNANLAMLVRVDNRLEKNIPLTVEVEALAEMVVAVRPLERGDVINAGDVALQKRDLAVAPGKVCHALAEVVGKRVRVGMRGNLPVRADYLEKVPLVKSGQLVTIVARNNALYITATGRVRNAAAEGELVQVQNLLSQKEVAARVVDANTVQVEF